MSAKIRLVDDEPQRNPSRRHVDDAGFAIEAPPGAHAALRCARGSQSELIVGDVRMGDVDVPEEPVSTRQLVAAEAMYRSLVEQIPEHRVSHAARRRAPVRQPERRDHHRALRRPLVRGGARAVAVPRACRRSRARRGRDHRGGRDRQAHRGRVSVPREGWPHAVAAQSRAGARDRRRARDRGPHRRHHGQARARAKPRAGAEDGGDRPAQQRHRARLQQPARGHPLEQHVPARAAGRR